VTFGHVIAFSNHGASGGGGAGAGGGPGGGSGRAPEHAANASTSESAENGRIAHVHERWRPTFGARSAGLRPAW
jgi:hypothetical protein